VVCFWGRADREDWLDEAAQLGVSGSHLLSALSHTFGRPQCVIVCVCACVLCMTHWQQCAGGMAGCSIRSCPSSHVCHVCCVNRLLVHAAMRGGACHWCGSFVWSRACLCSPPVGSQKVPLTLADCLLSLHAHGVCPTCADWQLLLVLVKAQTRVCSSVAFAVLRGLCVLWYAWRCVWHSGLTKAATGSTPYQDWSLACCSSACFLFCSLCDVCV
jgi:hypothetical protein